MTCGDIRQGDSLRHPRISAVWFLPFFTCMSLDVLWFIVVVHAQLPATLALRSCEFGGIIN